MATQIYEIAKCISDSPICPFDNNFEFVCDGICEDCIVTKYNEFKKVICSDYCKYYSENISKCEECPLYILKHNKE